MNSRYRFMSILPSNRAAARALSHASHPCRFGGTPRREKIMSDVVETSPAAASTREGRTAVKAFGAQAGDKPLEPMDIERRAPGPKDVQIEIAFCGVCHSDLHTVRGEWGGTVYPCVPG